MRQEQSVFMHVPEVTRSYGRTRPFTTKGTKLHEGKRGLRNDLLSAGMEFGAFREQVIGPGLLLDG
jgi:hypothetical protein